MCTELSKAPLTACWNAQICSKTKWAGAKVAPHTHGGSGGKSGNTCIEHCAALKLTNVNVNGRVRPEVTLRKCVWLRCCYGKKPYGVSATVNLETMHD